MSDYKRTNQGKGIAAFTKSEKFRSLISKNRSCQECQKKRQELLKSAELIKRINFKPSDLF
jgi:hypothetical protein